MTDGINNMEIDAARSELERMVIKKQEEAQKDIRDILIEKLARKDYRDVIRLSAEYKITIPEEHLLNAAKYVATVSCGRVSSICGEYYEVIRAGGIYRQFGMNDEADAVKKHIEEWDRITEQRELDRTWS